MRNAIIAGIIALFSIGTAWANTAAKPIFVPGEDCPPGSAVKNPWVVFEDRDGNGLYDYKTTMSCDGTLRWGPLSSITEHGHLPVGVIGLHSQFSYSVCGNQLYSWQVVLLDDNDVEVCRVEVNCSQFQSTTCEDLMGIRPESTGGNNSGFDLFGESSNMMMDSTIPGSASTAVVQPAAPKQSQAAEPKLKPSVK